jgi:hypothetical protein
MRMSPMRWHPRTFGSIAALAFVSIFALAYANHTWNDDQQSIGLLVGVGMLFLVFAYCLVPLMLRLFFSMQRAVGNADAAPIRWASANEKRITFGFWGLWTLGLVIAVPAMLWDFGVRLPVGKSQGVLSANIGMTLDEVRKRSSLPLGAGNYIKLTGTRQLIGDRVFDFELSGSKLRFLRCRYYWIETAAHDAEHVGSINVGISTESMSLAALKVADDAVRARVDADGWHAGQYYYRTDEQRQLHGGATGSGRGWYWLKGNTIVHLEHKRTDDEQPGEDRTSAGKWIQYLELSPRDEPIFKELDFDL